jgi:hypothetical protein
LEIAGGQRVGKVLLQTGNEKTALQEVALRAALSTNTFVRSNTGISVCINMPKGRCEVVFSEMR